MGTVGKKNILFGLAYFLTTLGLGIFLANQLNEGASEWLDSPSHYLLATAHAHGNLESLLNIVLGFLLCRFGAKAGKLSEATSGLLLLGAVFHSGMLYLAGLGVGAALNLAPVGAFFVVLGVACMLPVIWLGLEAHA